MNKQNEADVSGSQDGNPPWYAEGLRFSCSQCGACCSGSPGFVWVDQDEIRSIANFLGMDDVDEFERQYTKRKGLRVSIREFPNGDCLFLDETTRGCTIYDARPKQCRTWPFWGSNLKDEEAWRQTCEECPGAGTGRLYQLDEIEAQKRVIRI